MTPDEVKSQVSMPALIAKLTGKQVTEGKKFRCLLPNNHANGDKHPSATIKSNRLTCHSRKCFENDDVFSVIGKVEGLSDFQSQAARIEALFSLNGNDQWGKIESDYDYCNENGNLLYQTVRFKNPKDFRQRRPNGQGGWVWDLKGVRLVLYKFPEVMAAQNVLICEGEKDCEAACALGLPQGWAATTNPMGAGCWKRAYSEAVKGKNVTIIPDRDKPGQEHAEGVLWSLREVGVEAKILRLPGDGKDLADWIHAGGMSDEFHRLLESCAAPDLISLNSFNSYSPKWPELDEAALHGIAGDIVKTLAPYTEADKVTLLVHILSEFSCMIGRQPFIKLDGDDTYLMIFAVVVGVTSKSRKGSGSKRVKRFYQRVDPNWTRGKHSGSLSSGEGLIYAVRDEEWGENSKGEPVLKDEGILDKRLYLVQTEFGAMLRIMARDGNSLSGHIRDAWDGETLKPMTKGNRIQATHPHIAIVGHVTQAELLRNLDSTEMSNGFGNRFMWFCVKRSKCLPFAEDPPEAILRPLIEQLQKAIKFTDTAKEVGMTEEAKVWWEELYAELSESIPGVAGSLLDRGEAQVRRLAALYALLDCKADVTIEHLYAAMALWSYSVDSVKYLYGDRVGDPIADTILDALGKGPLSDSDISALFGKNVPAPRLAQAKQALVAKNKISQRTEQTAGRPKNIWEACTN